MLKKISTRRESERNKLFLENRSMQEVENLKKENDEQKIIIPIQKKINEERKFGGKENERCSIEKEIIDERKLNIVFREEMKISKKIYTEAEKIKQKKERKLVSVNCLKLKKEKEKRKLKQNIVK